MANFFKINESNTISTNGSQINITIGGIIYTITGLYNEEYDYWSIKLSIIQADGNEIVIFNKKAVCNYNLLKGSEKKYIQNINLQNIKLYIASDDNSRQYAKKDDFVNGNVYIIISVYE